MQGNHDALQTTCSDLEREISRHLRTCGILEANVQESDAVSSAIKARLGSLDKDVHFRSFNLYITYCSSRLLPLALICQLPCMQQSQEHSPKPE